MAAAVTLGELTDILECAVCLDTVHTPKMLTCNHSYCKRCLDGLLQFGTNGTAVIKCPKSCKETTKISNTQTTNDLGVDYMLKRISDVIVTKDIGKEKFKCESGVDCLRDVIAYCVVCDSFMCQPCSGEHKRCEQVNPFVYVSFDGKEKELNIICKKHGTEATYVCCNNEFICLYCLHRHHKGHSYDTLENQAEQLRGILSKEIEQMETFTENISRNLHETERDISLAKDNLEKILKMRKIKCISDYVDYLNKEEERIIEEFNLVATNHIKEFLIADPIESYKKYLSREGVKIVLRKREITNTMKRLKTEKTKNIKETTISLSEYHFNNVNALGNINITFGKLMPIDKAKKTFKDKLSMKGTENVSAKLLQMTQQLCQEVFDYKFNKNLIHQETPREQCVSSTDGLKIFMSGDKEEETRRFLGHTDEKTGTITHRRQLLSCATPTSNKSYASTSDGSKDTDNKKEHIDECLGKYEEGGMGYIEDLIQQGKNADLFLILREQPAIFYVSSPTAPFHNRTIHMASKYNNIEFLKGLIHYDNSMIDFKNKIGSNALHASASYTSSFDCFNWLAQTYPRMLENKNANGHTPLHVAASRNVVEAVKVLLSKEVNLWEEDNDGNTPLDLAKIYRCFDIIKILQEAMVQY